MKIIVYTVNINGYDRLNPSPRAMFPELEQDVRYLYFTNGEAPDGWEKIAIEDGDRKASRYWKINSHLLPEHEVSIYIDACAVYKKPVGKMATFLEDCDIALPKHPSNVCVYQHTGTCLLLQLDKPEVIFRHVGRYADEGMPANNGLTENGLIIRRNNEKVKELNELWWKEYQNGSQRDQLSLPYVLWKLKPDVHILPFSARENKWFYNDLNHLKLRNANI